MMRFLVKNRFLTNFHTFSSSLSDRTLQTIVIIDKYSLDWLHILFSNNFHLSSSSLKTLLFVQNEMTSDALSGFIGFHKLMKQKQKVRRLIGPMTLFLTTDTHSHFLISFISNYLNISDCTSIVCLHVYVRTYTYVWWKSFSFLFRCVLCV